MADSSGPMIADRAIREAALDPARSCIVQAPAGSGKTELLVRRFLKLLSVSKKPEEVLAITFTRKAAAEMRKRVLLELPDAAELATRLRIQTIDAFCTSLTRQMPVTARFGAQPGTLEDASGLYLEAAMATLRNLANPHVARLLGHLDNDLETAAGLLAGVLARRDQWLRRTGNPPTRAQLEEVLKSERKRIAENAKALLPDASEELARELLTKEGTWRKRNKRAQELSGNEPLRLALAALLAMPPESYADAQWEALEAILALLLPALQELLVIFAQRNQVDFTGIAHGALLALGSPEAPTDLLLALDSRINHILVDEFQDTSESQWQLLERLTAGWEEGEGRTLFVVGDPMQSIYRFREAEVGLFLRARGSGLPGVRLEPLTLSTNFRSQAGIVDWVNAFFPSVLPARADETSGAVPYSPSTTHAPALPGAAVQWHCFFDRGSEAGRAADLAKASAGSTAILVRNRSHLDEIVPALKAAGLRYRAVEIEQLGEKQVVQDLYALTRALLHPADQVAWFAILRAPWFGLSLEDFCFYFENKKDKTVWETIQAVPAFERFTRVLAPALENRLRGTLRDRVEGCWLALGGPACVESQTDLEDAGVFLDELEKLEVAGDLPDLALLEEKLAKLWALPDVDAGAGAVEIMTIHKAKGLEWDNVIVPGLDRYPRPSDRTLFKWKSLPSGLLLAPINETGTDKDPLYEYVRELDKEAEDIEAGRLFYVAATRAKQRLHLLACAKADEAGAPKPPNKRSLLAKGWFEAVQAFPSFSPNAEPEREKPGTGGMLRRLPAGYAVPPPPASVAWQAPPDGRDDAAQIEFSWAGETARHVGTVVHRWLQRMAEDELKGWDAKRVESLRARFESDLHRRGVDAAGPAAELVVTALKNTLADERGRWLLGPHAEAKSEYRIRTATGRYVIDRLIREPDGRRLIVDYKTGRNEGGDLDQFLDRERERYAKQLRRYLAALENSRAGLYFPMHQGWRDADAN